MFFPYLMAGLAGLAGFGGLLVFAVFLISGSPTTIPLHLSEPAILWFDAALSLSFFLQHSLMVRQGFRRCMSRYISKPYQEAVYSVISGLLLLLIILFWQKSGNILLSLQSPLRWVYQSGIFFSIALFSWVMSVVGALDPFGVHTIVDHIRGQKTVHSGMVIRGPYRWVRHPAYLCMLLMIWACPDITLDRLLLNCLWSVWILIGTYFEERDLVSVYGEQYRAYQKQVPRLIPWKFRPLKFSLVGGTYK
jgi:protein-S-isoprenylcysteine O-methyltransferase Ste14